VHHARHPAPWRWGRAAVVTEATEVLPEAAREGDGVAASFWFSTRLHGKDAYPGTGTPGTVARSSTRTLLLRIGPVMSISFCRLATSPYIFVF